VFGRLRHETQTATDRLAASCKGHSTITEQGDATYCWR